MRYSIIGAVLAGLGAWQVAAPTIDWVLAAHSEYVTLRDRVATLEKEVACLWRIQAKQPC